MSLIKTAVTMQTSIDGLNDLADKMEELKEFAQEMPKTYHEFDSLYNEIIVSLDQYIGNLERLHDRFLVRMKIVSAYAACDSNGINITKIDETINQLIAFIGE